jgi:hypothetical protein
VPDYSAWPAPADVWATLAAAGLMASVPNGQEPPAPLTNLPWQQWCDAPVSELEAKTDRHPFVGETRTIRVQTTTLTDRGHEPWGRANRYLTLPSSVLSVTSIKLYQANLYGQILDPATPGTGITLTPWQDYRLEPTSAPGRGQAYTGIAFFWGHGLTWPGENGMLEITGTIGQLGAIPAHLWTMALQLAVAEALPAVEGNAIKTTLGAEALLGQTIKVKTEEVERTIGAGRGTDTGLSIYRAGSPGHSALRSKWNAAMRTYRRRTFM